MNSANAALSRQSSTPIPEQETTIVIDRATQTARIYTSDTTMITRMRKNFDNYRTKSDNSGEWYECPTSYIKVRKPRQLSEESRLALAERARNNFRRD